MVIRQILIHISICKPHSFILVRFRQISTLLTWFVSHQKNEETLQLIMKIDKNNLHQVRSECNVEFKYRVKVNSNRVFFLNDLLSINIKFLLTIFYCMYIETFRMCIRLICPLWKLTSLKRKLRKWTANFTPLNIAS